jgi:DNA-directed RNA polymerase specialized sigma24 family protein
MTQAAERGIVRAIRASADVQDVQNVVYDAFCELERQDPHQIKNLVGFAARIAYMRGLDCGGKIIREATNTRKLAADPAYRAELEFSDLDAVMAEQRAQTAELALECLDILTDEQRSVVEQTIMRAGNLSDWAFHEGKTYQAAGAQRVRALRALRRCVDRKLQERRERKEGSR